MKPAGGSQPELRAGFSLYIRGPEPMLDLLLKEKPSKRVLQLQGIYYSDSRMFMLHDLDPFNEKPNPSGLLQ